MLNLFSSKSPLVMGILNVTPDSFYDGGKYTTLDMAVKRAEEMLEEGADIIDIGGESTRPYAEPVPLEEELKRVVPVVKEIKKRFPQSIISVDTYKAEVARRALDEGADIVNDVSAARFDPQMIEVLSSYNPYVVVMHMKGTPRDMQKNPYYEDVISEVSSFLEQRRAYLIKHGVSPDKIIVDPGIGFGKRVEDNLKIIKCLEIFTNIAPVLVGPSRKSFIGAILDLPPQERLEGTLAVIAICVLKGAKILRVHDVKETKRAVKIAQAVRDVGECS